MGVADTVILGKAAQRPAILGNLPVMYKRNSILASFYSHDPMNSTFRNTPFYKRLLLSQSAGRPL